MNVETEPDTAAVQLAREQLTLENARLRGDLLTVAKRISHDLRTPLGGIIINAEMLKETLAENGAASGSGMTAILDSAGEMTCLIERVSFVLKATANPVAGELVNMGDVVLRVRQRHEGKILKKNLTVSEPDSWPEVNGVSTWLEVIWGNLLANALHHAKNHIELGWQENKSEICFSVGDNGGGVPAELRAQLFQPFDSLHKPECGRGLGLSIVQRLVDLQGGHCGYKHLSGGPVFFFTLPVVK